MSQAQSSEAKPSWAGPYSKASDLPPELVYTILQKIPSITKDGTKEGKAGGDTSTSDRRTLSLCASTCKTWARHLQPILYATITLRSQEDLQTLIVFLKSPISGVRYYIRRLHIKESSALRPWSHISTLSLQRRLTALESLSQAYVPASDTTNPATIIRYPLAINELSALRNSFSTVAKLSLLNYAFPTFLAFERMIRSLPNVADIVCQNITWQGSVLVNRPRVPRLRSNSIQQLRATNCPDLWSLFWLFRSSEDPEGDRGLLSPTEIPCIIELASRLFDVKEFIDATFQVLCDEPEARRVQVSASVRHIKADPGMDMNFDEQREEDKYRRIIPTTTTTPLICVKAISGGDAGYCVSALELYRCMPSAIQRYDWDIVSRQLRRLMHVSVNCCVIQKTTHWHSLGRHLEAILHRTKCTVDFVETTPYTASIHLLTVATSGEGLSKNKTALVFGTHRPITMLYTQREEIIKVAHFVGLVDNANFTTTLEKDDSELVDFVTHLTSAELDSICFENHEHLSQADYIGLLNLLDFILLPDNILTKSDAMEARHIVRHITEEQRREIRNIVVKLSIVSDELPEQWYYLSKSSASEALCGQFGVVAHCKFPKITSINHRIAIFRYLQHPAIPSSPNVVEPLKNPRAAEIVYGFDVESLQLIPMESNDTRRELIVGYEDHADLPNLEQYLLQPLTLQCRVRLVLSLISVISYIHSEGFVHGDLCRQTLFIDKSGHLRLAISTELDSTQEKPLVSDAWRYIYPPCTSESTLRRYDATPPEWPFVSEAGDVYCFANLYRLLIPTRTNTHGHVPSEELRELCGDTVHDALLDVMEECTALQPERRPTSTALYHTLQSLLEPLIASH